MQVAVTSGALIGLWAVIYLVLLVALGISSIRRGHWVMVIVGCSCRAFGSSARFCQGGADR
jgi:hypothetical protein